MGAGDVTRRCIVVHDDGARASWLGAAWVYWSSFPPPGRCAGWIIGYLFYVFAHRVHNSHAHSTAFQLSQADSQADDRTCTQTMIMTPFTNLDTKMQTVTKYFRRRLAKKNGPEANTGSELALDKVKETRKPFAAVRGGMGSIATKAKLGTCARWLVAMHELL